MKPTTAPEISVVVCTHNRAQLLRKCLNSLATQTLPPDRFEVIVIDNKSTDTTQAESARFCNENSNFTYLYEPNLGLSVARNTGGTSARGRFVTYIDDDAIAAPNWLEILGTTFKSAPETVGIVAGRVDPLWEQPPPPWLTKRFWHLFSVLDLGGEARLLSDDEWFVGANMSIRKDLLQQLGGFNTSLGRKGSSLLSNEELELSERVKQLGYSIYYEPRAIVSNLVPQERASKKWLKKRMYWQGVSVARHHERTHHRADYRARRKVKLVFVAILLLVEKCTTIPWHRFQGNLEQELGWHYRLGLTLQNLSQP